MNTLEDLKLNADQMMMMPMIEVFIISLNLPSNYSELGRYHHPLYIKKKMDRKNSKINYMCIELNIICVKVSLICRHRFDLREIKFYLFSLNLGSILI